jgi:aminoglycoside phosphotransferase family enzyme/predicted kinase
LTASTCAAEQREAAEALQSGRATGAGAPLRRIDTHISHVFLAPELAYKLKRAVRLPFLDFSTLELRRGACEAELEVNRRLAPQLYLGVEPVTRGSDGAVTVAGPGEPIDWVVVMRRFEDGALLEEMARAGTLTPALVGRAAEAIAGFHATAPPAPEFGKPEHYLAIIDGLGRTEADGAAAHGLPLPSRDLHAALEAEVRRVAPLIEQRRVAGKVRRGHGDLHLRNLCLFEGEPVAFDALEFDPALASADVLYDLAFLLMDLRRWGLGAHANLAMNRYWDAAGEDEAGLALLPVFMALRSAVRAAVAMEAGKADEAETYRALGQALLAPSGPRLVAIGGLSGTGKSAVAAVLAPELGGPCEARRLRTDVIRKAMAGVAPSRRLEDEAYAPQRRAEVYAVLASRAAEALAAGAAVIADATFQEEGARRAVVGAAGAAPLDALWLRAPLQVRLQRIGGRAGDPSDADAAVAAAQVEPVLEPAWIVVDACGTLGDVAARARQALALPARED